MLRLTQLVGFGVGGGYQAEASSFVAGSDNRHASSLSGVSDSPLGSLSLWVRFDAKDGGTHRILVMDGYVIVTKNTSNKMGVTVRKGDAVTTFSFDSSNAYTSGAAWHHLAASWDTNHAAGNKIGTLYIDGSSDFAPGSDVATAFSVGYGTNGGHVVCPGATPTPDATDDLYGSLAEVWFAPGQFVDFSSPANVQKFRSTAGKPVYLGTDGSLPTGAAPLVYLKSPAATAGTNSGTGGNLTVVGTPTATQGP